MPINKNLFRIFFCFFFILFGWHNRFYATVRLWMFNFVISCVQCSMKILTSDFHYFYAAILPLKTRFETIMASIWHKNTFTLILLPHSCIKLQQQMLLFNFSKIQLQNVLFSFQYLNTIHIKESINS